MVDMSTVERLTPDQETLTPAQETLLNEIYNNEYIADLTRERSMDETPDPEVIKRWLTVAYRLYSMTVPARIDVVGSPFAAIKLATELTGAAVDNTDWCGACDEGWVSSFDFFHRVGVITSEEAADVLALRDFGRAAWDTLLLDECAIVVRRPLRIVIDDAGRPHNATGPCVEWADGEKDYAWHGVWIPAKMIESPKSYTREEFAKITSTEVRRALCEINGWAWLAELLGASVVNSWTDPKTSLTYDLLRYDGGQLLRKQSPILQDGSQPLYIEPVHEDLRTARAARKWQATALEVTACENDPDLTYGIER